MYVFTLCIWCVSFAIVNIYHEMLGLILGQIKEGEIWCFYGDLFIGILDCGKNFV